MYKVIKRDKQIVEFNIEKISSAITKAFDAEKINYDQSTINLLALNVTSDYQEKIKDNLIQVEDIQDSVEKVLIKAGYAEVAKAYILYRKQREKIRNVNQTTQDYLSLIDRYLNEDDQEDYSYSIGGLVMNNSGAITTNYWLEEVYDKEISEAHKDGSIYIHDLEMLTGKDAGWSIKQVIERGLIGLSGQMSSRCPKHLSTLCNQLVNFVGIMQNEWAGNQTFRNFDTYLAPFVRIDNLTFNEVKQAIESFVYGVNIPTRWGSLAPLVNISLDLIVPKDLANIKPIIGGKEVDFTYQSLQKEMDMIVLAYLELLNEQDDYGNSFRYPKTTISISKDFDWDNQLSDLIFKSLLEHEVILSNDDNYQIINTVNRKRKIKYSELKHRCGGFDDYAPFSGSIGKVSINLPRIAYLSKDENDFYERLDYLLDISSRSLKTKKDVIIKLFDEGLYPYSKHYLDNLNDYSLCIGILGLNDCVYNASWIKETLSNDKGLNFGVDILNHFQDKLIGFQTKYESLFSLDETKKLNIDKHFVNKDKENDYLIEKLNNDLYCLGSDVLNDDIFSVLDLQSKLKPLFNGKSETNLRLDNKNNDIRAFKSLIKKVFENYHLSFLKIIR